MIKKILFSLVLFLSITTLKLSAQQGKVDVTFNTLDDGLNGDGFDNTVRTLSLQADQNLIVGGDYLNLNGISSPYLTRLNPDGNIDSTFDTGTGFNGKVYSSHIQSDGKIIVGGSFTSYNGINAGRLIRLNTDGSNDPSFNTSTAATTGIIYAIEEQVDGKIIIVGSFTKYNGITVNRIARILPNGALDPSFNTGTGSTLNITNIVILADGKILLSGNFTSFNGTASNRLVRLYPDGKVDTSFNIGTGFDDDVSAMVMQPDGKIILGGKFTTYNGMVANRIIRINEDESKDNSFLSGSGINSGAVQTIKLSSSGDIMVGGSFTGNYNGTDINRVFLLNRDGIIKTNVDFGSGPGSAPVLALENDSEGSWYIGGSFSIFDGLNQGRLAKIDAEGEYDTAYLSAGIGFDNSVYKVLPLENKKTMVFGNFKKFNGEFASKIARLSEDGSLDTSFNSEQTGANNYIKTAVLQADGKIIFGGNFTNYNGINSNRLIRILPDGSVDTTFNIGFGFTSYVYTMAIQPDQKIIVAGSFTSYNKDSSLMRIVRLLPDGTRDTSFNIGRSADGIIETVLIQPDGKILLGGQFNNFDGHSFAKLIRLNSDGSIDSGFNVGSGFDKNVYAIALQSDGKIIVGGAFLNYNGSSQKRILRLNSNGSLDTSFDSGTGFSKGDVRSIIIQPDDRILVGGTFSGTYKNHASLRLIRLLKTGDYDLGFEARLNNKLFSMGFTSDYRLIIAGDFNSISGISKHRIARLKLCLDSTTWNGITWSNGFPSGGKQVFFKDNYSALTSANVCNCSIDEGKTVTVLNGNTLGIEFDYSGLGTLILEDTASLYQSDDETVNTGIIHVKRKSSPILKFDYTYWSSPVENQKLIGISPYTSLDKFFSYSIDSDSWKQENPSDKMVSGRGYIIRGPQYFSPSEPEKFEVIFKGIPFNGKVSLSFQKADGFNLVGNPYPSALNADIFLTKNTSNIQGTLYFWTHNTPFTNNKYGSDDYAVYNLLGGVGTHGALSSGINENIPDGTIASGQAFFVNSKRSQIIDFDDTMRISGKNTTFFKPLKTKENFPEKHRIWLNLKNNEGIFKQILLGYINGATNLYDDSYDAESLNANQFVDFYSIVENKKLVIQGRGLPFENTDSILLGYSSSIDGEFNLSIDHDDGLFSTLDVFVEDKNLKIKHNLKESPYLFSTKKGTFNDRFELNFISKNLKTDDEKIEANQILVFVNNNKIFIDAAKNEIKNITIFDISGKQIYRKTNIENSKFRIENPSFKNQILLVKISLENGHHATRKISI
ncbi:MULTISPECIES: T9SS sorting signal type C domain-containing protein [unclassified Flavobacterium]|uniref:T9SS sorting signal type C domain-containing protein n=1 Tax=unclassified Flavobacterium TaxID=196869 RepID=UPI0012B93EC7|nr:MULTISPECIES: T9SS sorting signal type C domain-containing protein [unclassified Flavobacterium]